LSGIHGTPKALWLGQESKYHVMVLKHLGPSLEDCFKACGQKFLQINLTWQFSHLQNIHSSHYIHCDIKPANILTGLKDSLNMLYLADFGIAKQYHHP
ncbi:hypothetical protein SCLCIDRAFT_36895, partial [Scleroderma citrinum Foug A]